MRDGFACHLAHVQNLAAAGSGKGRRGNQAKLPVIPSVIEEFATLDILASSEMGIIQVSFIALANSVALCRCNRELLYQLARSS
jgi:hypothetical protein